MLTAVSHGQNTGTKQESESMKTVYDFSLTDAKGNKVSLSEYKGKVLLISIPLPDVALHPSITNLKRCTAV